MTPEEFEFVLDDTIAALNTEAQKNKPFPDPKDFEQIVLQALQKACKDKSVEPTNTYHPHAFPDITVNGFGVEVKHTKKDSWSAVGNSVFEGMADPKAQEGNIYIVFGKMGGFPEVRWAKYEDCVTHVRISHAPRFVIEMDRVHPLFSRINMPYAEFRKLSPEQKMCHIRRYARGRLREGEQLWWLEDREDGEHSLPISVKVYRTLDDVSKRQMRAEATLLFPEIVQGAHQRGKYDRAGLYLITEHGVYTPQLRDLFSAGSVGGKGGQRGGIYIIRAIQDIEGEIREAAQNLDDRLFLEYWEMSCPPENRISEWLRRADQYATDWVPSNELFQSN